MGRDSTGVALVAAAGVAVLLSVGLLSGAVAGAATAGDRPTVIYAGQDSYTVTAGGTFEMDVYAQSDGGVGEVGVEAMTVVTAHDESVLTAEEVEPATWLEGDEPTNVETDVAVADEEGRVTVEQWRDPPAGGTTGNERFVTITFSVASDAPTGNATVSFADSDVRLTDEYSVPVYGNEVNVTVEEAGGGGGVPATALGVGLAAVATVLVLGAVVVRRR